MDKPISFSKPPIGAKHTSLKTPKETIQMIGKPEVGVPKSVSVDLGVVDIYITNYGKNIEFRGRGLETDVGKRLSSPTKGMSLREEKVLANDRAEALGIKPPKVRRAKKAISSRGEKPKPNVLEVF